MRKTLTAVFLATALLSSSAAFAVVTSTTTETTPVACNGATVVFSFSYKATTTADLAVMKTRVSTGATTTLVIGTDYTAALTSPAGGTVTLTAGAKCPTGYTLKIRRILPLTQTTAFSTSGAFSPRAHENAFDKLTLVQQQLERDRLAGNATLLNQIGTMASTLRSEMSPAGEVLDARTVLSTGSVTARTLAARFADVKNVLDFGASCDNSTDDTVAIQAAINATPERATLLFPKNGCVAGPLTGKEGIVVVGPQGNEYNDVVSTLRYRDTTGNFITLTGGDSQEGMTFRDMVVDGNATTGRVFNLQTSRSRFENCTVKNGGVGSYGIFVTHGGTSTAVENTIRNSRIYGFGVGLHAEGNATDGIVVDSWFYGNRAKDIELTQAAGWLVEGNHTYGNVTGRAVSIYAGTSGARILGNYVEGNTLTAGFIGIQQVYNTSVSTGSIFGNAIQLVSNNSIGIDLTASTPTRGSVASNTVWVFLGATGTIGIKVSGGSTIYGNLTFNNLENCATPLSSSFGGTTNAVSMSSGRVDYTATELRMQALSTYTRVLVGSGTPDLVVTAPAGSVFMRTDGADGTVLYAKKWSAPGTTGWRGVTTQMTRVTVTPATLTGNVANYDAAPLGETFIRLSSDASHNISGLLYSDDGRTVTLINVGARDIVILNDNAGSNAFNRILTKTAGDVTLTPGMVMNLIYDNVSARWREI